MCLTSFLYPSKYFCFLPNFLDDGYGYPSSVKVEFNYSGEGGGDLKG